MGMNIAAVEYVLQYGHPNIADAFLQDTARAAREAGSQGYSVLMTFPKMCSGRKLDSYMKTYVNGETCIQNSVCRARV